MDFKKALACVGVLMVATGGPITLCTTGELLPASVRDWFSASPTATAKASVLPPAAPNPTVSAVPANPENPPAAIRAPASPVATEILPSLGEVFNFDVTADWVMRRWPRVSTGLPNLPLQGYRVPLVTGTKTSDLAGSLTYYFDARQQAQQISFRGTTGDPAPLVALLGSRFHFTRRIINDPSVVLYEAVDASNQPAGSLKVRSAKVVKANQPFTKFEIELVVHRPG